jgi:hypothetical protein
MKKFTKSAQRFLVPLLVLSSIRVLGSQVDDPEKPLLEFSGKIYPNRFLRVKGISYGHHAIAWTGGGAAKFALIETDTPDREIADRLAGMGVAGGNNLTAETWNARNDPANPAADQRVTGASLEIRVLWEGLRKARTLRSILGMPEAEYRFGDHRALIPIWKSGCVVCNVSCPGAKISNHTLTIRDQAQGRLRPDIDVSSLPPDGTPVRIGVFRRLR